MTFVLNNNDVRLQDVTELLPKGISPELLREQIRNTAPFIFEKGGIETSRPLNPRLRFLEVARSTAPICDLPAYFELCLSAHHATVATFVPTDVDNQIRFKLWNPRLPSETLEKMFDWVFESLNWDSTAVSERWVRSPETGEILSGHQGEWFSTAAAAYGAFRKRDGDRAALMAQMIIREIQREAQVFEDLVRARDWISVLKATPLIAHNLGDLDRVIEQWSLSDDDPLKVAVFKAGHEPKPLLSPLLHRAGELNKVATADENHRHFALRKVRCLRKHRDFLVGIGPFFDEWGRHLARHPALRPEDVGEVAEGLIAGWEWMKGKSVGYARALAGIEQGFEGGLSRLCQVLPARAARTLRSGDLRAKTSISRERFEAQWSQLAEKYFSALGLMVA